MAAVVAADREDFAILIQPVRVNNALVAMGGVAYGGVLYLISFQVLAQYVPQFSALSMANQPFELATQLFYGGLVALFVLRP